MKLNTPRPGDAVAFSFTCAGCGAVREVEMPVERLAAGVYCTACGHRLSTGGTWGTWSRTSFEVTAVAAIERVWPGARLRWLLRENIGAFVLGHQLVGEIRPRTLDFMYRMKDRPGFEPGPVEIDYAKTLAKMAEWRARRLSDSENPHNALCGE